MIGLPFKTCKSTTWGRFRMTESDDTDGYWSHNPVMRELATKAAMTGASLDQLYLERGPDCVIARILSARSNGSLSHLPSIKKSSETP